MKLQLEKLQMHRKQVSILNFLLVKKYTDMSQGYIVRITFLMFCGPCVVIYPCNKNQQDELFSVKLISIINLYMFRTGLLLIIR
jgi:hypothetical protein